jgi:valyl-tRNA synthetase
MKEINKNYEHLSVEDSWYEHWEEKGYFAPRGKGKPFSMVIPPPNVTGALHMGHALNHTLQDIMARYHRLRGRRVLWVPGTDHAGIATQNVVDKKLLGEGINREDLGREAFIEKVWEWKEQYGNTITKQIRKLGASVDWSRERFTMDEGCSKAVRENFVKLYEEDLIYKGTYITNWCPKCQTALSDIEVEHQDEDGHFWHMTYAIVGSKGHVEIATTRPETMFGDTAVAVHPEDSRYKKYIGKTVMLPFMDKEIPIVADAAVDPDFGTGVVKVTPAHDANDYDIGRRHNLEEIKIMDIKGMMNENVPEAYQGLDRYVCRKKLVKDLDALGALVKVEDHNHAVGHCYRCDTVIEPYLSAQWFVNMAKIVAKPIAAVKDGSIKFVPDRWKKMYFDWMENIRPWCISRQIWWGHQIPVWTCDDCGEEMVSKTDITGCTKCKSENVTQDKDVLDTWFSSALWPFSTLGWPEKTDDVESFYPTNTLITGYDIITFWVSRMITMGLYNFDQIPFDTVYIHGLVRDASGRKMSKSLGNVVDPLQIIEDKGADALRYTVASLVASGGQDVRFTDDRLLSSRNFLNKIWNICRYILLQDVAEVSAEDTTVVDQWILQRFNQARAKMIHHYEAFEFNFAADQMYEFVWGEFCDWYVEMTKLHKASSQKTLIVVLNGILKLLHPIIPFITEEIWNALKEHPLFPEDEKSLDSIMLTSWPDEFDVPKKDLISEVEHVQQIIKTVRNLRAEMNVPPSRKGTLVLCNAAPFVKEYLPYLSFLSRSQKVEFSDAAPQEKSSFAVVGDVDVYLPLEGLIDLGLEKSRLEKEMISLDQDIVRLKKKLSNEGFLKKAPEEVVNKEKMLLGEKTEQADKVKQKIAALV